MRISPCTFLKDFLRRHYPHQVTGRNSSSQPLFRLPGPLFNLLYHNFYELSSMNIPRFFREALIFSVTLVELKIINIWEAESQNFFILISQKMKYGKFIIHAVVGLGFSSSYYCKIEEFMFVSDILSVLFTFFRHFWTMIQPSETVLSNPHLTTESLWKLFKPKILIHLF